MRILVFKAILLLPKKIPLSFFKSKVSTDSTDFGSTTVLNVGLNQEDKYNSLSSSRTNVKPKEERQMMIIS
jgi:hypothetical protein